MTDYEPTAALAAWLADGWQHGDDCEFAGIAWEHLCGHEANFGTWQQNSDTLTVELFGMEAA